MTLVPKAAMVAVASSDEGGQIVHACGSPSVRATGKNASPGLGSRSAK